jgi:hypothetical protein
MNAASPVKEQIAGRLASSEPQEQEAPKEQVADSNSKSCKLGVSEGDLEFQFLWDLLEKVFRKIRGKPARPPDPTCCLSSGNFTQM